MFDLENPDDLYSWSTNKLWNALKTLDIPKEHQDTYSTIKYGKHINIPIWYITQTWYSLHPSTKKVTILGYGKYELSTFMEEIELRDSLMRNMLLMAMQNPELLSPRH